MGMGCIERGCCRETRHCTVDHCQLLFNLFQLSPIHCSVPLPTTRTTSPPPCEVSCRSPAVGGPKAPTRQPSAHPTPGQPTRSAAAPFASPRPSVRNSGRPGDVQSARRPYPGTVHPRHLPERTRTHIWRDFDIESVFTPSASSEPGALAPDFPGVKSDSIINSVLFAMQQHIE